MCIACLKYNKMYTITKTPSSVLFQQSVFL